MSEAKVDNGGESNGSDGGIESVSAFDSALLTGAWTEISLVKESNFSSFNVSLVSTRSSDWLNLEDF